MNDELERRLRAFEHEPGEDTRAELLRAFRAEHRRPSLWHRRFPTYEMLGLLLVAGALSFVAGQRSKPTTEDRSTVAAATDTIPLVWSRAETDQLRTN